MLTKIDNKLTYWMATHGVAFLRISIGAFFYGLDL